MTVDDIQPILDYWFTAEDSFLIGMGVDLAKMPKKEEFSEMLSEQVRAPYESKKSFCMIWLVDDMQVGHSNVNKIIFGEEAFMHLHIWKNNFREKGIGTELVKLTIPYFFEKLKLKRLLCEPYSKNPSPHKTIEKVGFRFVKEYITTPGWINFEQPVKQWMITPDMISSQSQ